MIQDSSMEQARERLRHATAVCAAAETGYWEQRTVHGMAAGTLLRYREQLLEEKQALTEEVLRHLGLRVLPSRGSPSRSAQPDPGKLPRPKLLEKHSGLVLQQEQQHRRRLAPPTSPATDTLSIADDRLELPHQQRRETHDVRPEPSRGVDAWEGGGEDGNDQLSASQSVLYDDEVEDCHPRDGRSSATARYDTPEWSGRHRLSNTENEVPKAVVPIPASEGGISSGSCSGSFSGNRIDTPPVHRQQQSSWRKLKKLDHHHTRQQLQTSPPRATVTAVPVDIDVRPYKRTRRVSTEEDHDVDSLNTSTNSSNGRGSYHAYNGSSDSEASSRHHPAVAAPSPSARADVDFYLRSPVVASTPSPATTSDITTAITNTNTPPSLPSVRDLNLNGDRQYQHHPYRHRECDEWDRQGVPRAVGGRSCSDVVEDDDAAAAAVRVLGLRNGRGSGVAAAAAVVATQPSSAAAAVGSKRGREFMEQGQSPLPPVADGIRTGGRAVDSTTVMMARHGGGGGGGGIAGGQASTGTLKWAGKSKGNGAVRASRGAQACRDVGCHRRPIYAYQGDTKALCCPIHRTKEMVNVRHPLCRHESCFRQPSFGMEGDQRASFCSEHKAPDMINVSSRRCQASGCLRHPNFGFPGDRRATFCCRHKATGMIDVVSRRCQHPQCVRRPLYAMAGQRAMFCRTHKDPEHTDVVSRRCSFEEGCDRHPSFGWKHGDGKARRCAHHRLEGMESVKVNNRRGNAAAANALKAKQTLV